MFKSNTLLEAILFSPQHLLLQPLGFFALVTSDFGIISAEPWLCLWCLYKMLKYPGIFCLCTEPKCPFYVPPLWSKRIYYSILNKWRKSVKHVKQYSCSSVANEGLTQGRCVYFSNLVCEGWVPHPASGISFSLLFWDRVSLCRFGWPGT